MNKRSLSDRRRAIYTGLKPFFDDPSLMQAVTHWENRYSDQPSLALQRYVADICQNPVLKDKRASILRSLLHAMTQDSAELLADPRGPEPATPNTAETASASVAYSVLMLAMMSQVDESLQHKLRIELFAALRQRQLPPTILEALQNWLGTRQPLKLNNAPSALLQKLLNQYYVLLCENLGPVRADTILARGVAQVQRQHPELEPFIDSLL